MLSSSTHQVYLYRGVCVHISVVSYSFYLQDWNIHRKEQPRGQGDTTSVLLLMEISQIIYFLTLFWGYIVEFTEVLVIYQIYYSWIHSVHHSPSSPSPPYPEIVSTGLIFPFTCMCT
jgi:sterol desaturase/sphingolipid hydroxylase (fatty acid hydroxylase superfamily)